MLYLGGSWVAWLVRTVLWRSVLQGDQSAFYEQESGASGGLASQMLFLARANPSERFRFSLYFVPVPIELSAWQSLLAHCAMDLFVHPKGANGMVGDMLANLAAWAFGWVVYNEWMRHV
eukprot:gnl/TRDRNA2_/TRDRNA2_145926_c0_seq1.p2 gnl/TRDRNA2_/TRDRNA2_145926_c0~~gnl/TRDRNA2_/TRDRNA2_145926_c0_seq1.p2  ORF type:complete len:119 (+),score=16.93 gnl/TRDRNA2_/TRDRNA2_145926_c0_seq1:231-587(+)